METETIYTCVRFIFLVRMWIVPQCAHGFVYAHAYLCGHTNTPRGKREKSLLSC